MDGKLRRLWYEIECVVTVPYVPSLQNLYVLVQSSEPPTIGSWALYKPCQVGLLADVLVDALSRSRVALPLITKFASSMAFRDALLERYPMIFDAFLEKALHGDSAEYSAACVALFSSPLPANCVPSARIAPFIAKLVDTMAENPCVETVRPLHTLIAGLQSSPKVLDDIPTEVMSNLQVEFTKTLRNLDDHMGNLLCLATFAQIATALSTAQNQHRPETPSWLLNINHFFGQKRGLKTLDLVVLRVILACSSSCNLSPLEAAESIRLAICIADAIEPQPKQAWIAGNSSKIAKLCDKASGDGLHSKTKAMVIVFLHNLLPAHLLSSQLRELGIGVLLSKQSQEILETIPQKLILRLAKTLAESGESTIRQFLSSIISDLKSSQIPGIVTLAGTQLSHLLLVGLQEANSHVIAPALDSSMVCLREVLGTMIEYFPRQASESQCKDRSLCIAQLNTIQNKLCLSLLDLYYRASSTNEDDLIMKFFMARVERSMLRVDCAFSAATPTNYQGSLVLHNRVDLPSTQINRNWRSGITEAFMQNAQASHDSVMRKIEDACFDLERRCNDVEGPLRAVEEERDRYAHESEQLKRRNEELDEQLRNQTREYESKLWDSSESFKELGLENTRLGQLLQGQYEHVEELTTSLNSTRDQLQDYRRSSEQATVVEREKARSKELEMMATLTEKEYQLEELQKEISALQTKNEETQQSLQTVSTENVNLADLCNSLKQEVLGVTDQLKQTKICADHNKNELNCLVAQEQDLRQELDSVKLAAETQDTEAKRIRSILQQSEDELRSELEMLKQQHEAELSRAMAKQDTEKRRLQAAMQAAALDASKDAQAKDKRVQHLERKVQALRDERAAKAREFSEAQQHIGRLMGVMGFSANTPETNAPPKHRRVRSSMHPTTPGARASEPISDDEDGTQLSQSFESIASGFNGPPPKRSRGNHQAHESGEQSTTASKTTSSPSTGRSSRSARKPFAEADRNSPTKPQSSTASKRDQVEDSFQELQAQGNVEENRLRSLDLDMDLEFSRDFIFTSTDFTKSDDQTA